MKCLEMCNKRLVLQGMILKDDNLSAVTRIFIDLDNIF